MRRQWTGFFIVGLASVLAVVGCRKDGTACEDERDCFRGEICVSGLCQSVVEADADAGGEDTGRSDVEASSSDGGNGSDDVVMEEGDDVFDVHDEVDVVDPPLEGFVSIQARGRHSCAVDHDGEVTCWGEDVLGKLDVVQGAYRSVHPGWGFTCGVRLDGTVRCWGHTNQYGEPPPEHYQFREFSAGSWHTCGVLTDGSSACWGRSVHGETAVPVTDGDFVYVGAGEFYSCGLTLEGQVHCWGDSTLDGLPAETSESFERLFTGERFACGLDGAGELTCWGRTQNTSGETEPPAGPYIDVALGRFHGCAIRDNATLTCWGYNAFGQTNAPGGTYRAVAAGDRHSCAIRTDGLILCWGDDQDNQLAVPVVDP